MKKFLIFIILFAISCAMFQFFLGYDENKHINESYDFSSRLSAIGDVVSEYWKLVNETFNDFPNFANYLDKYDVKYDLSDFEEIDFQSDSIKEIIGKVFYNSWINISIVFKFLFVLIKFLYMIFDWSFKIIYATLKFIFNFVKILIIGGDSLWVSYWLYS